MEIARHALVGHPLGALLAQQIGHLFRVGVIFTKATCDPGRKTIGFVRHGNLMLGKDQRLNIVADRMDDGETLDKAGDDHSCECLAATGFDKLRLQGTDILERVVQLLFEISVVLSNSRNVGDNFDSHIGCALSLANPSRVEDSGTQNIHGTIHATWALEVAKARTALTVCAAIRRECEGLFGPSAVLFKTESLPAYDT